MKKNKKLFAILTLVAFMMTLMPVMAFAADTFTASIDTERETEYVAPVAIDLRLDTAVTTDTIYKITFNGNAVGELMVPNGQKASQITISANKSTREQLLPIELIKVADDTSVGSVTVKIKASNAKITEEKWAALCAEAGNREPQFKSYTPSTVTQATLDAFKAAQRVYALEGPDAQKAAVIATVPDAGTADAYFDVLAAYEALVDKVDKNNWEDFKNAFSVVSDDVDNLAEFIGKDAETLQDINDAKTLSEVKELVKEVGGNTPILPITGDASKEASVLVAKDTSAESSATAKVVGGKLVETIDGVQKDLVDTKYVELEMVFRTAGKAQALKPDGGVYVWAEENGQVSDALVLEKGDKTTDNPSVNVYHITAADLNNGANTFKAAFLRSGEFVVKASMDDPTEEGKSTLRTVLQFTKDLGDNIVKVTSAAQKTREFTVAVGTGKDASGQDNKNNIATALADGKTTKTAVKVAADTVATTKVTLTVRNNKGALMSTYPLRLSTNSANIELDKTSLTTNYNGEATFNVAGLREGEYKIYVNIGDYEATIKVQVGATSANDIQLIKFPSNPIATDTLVADYKDIFRFQLTDANGNIVTGNDPKGAQYASLTTGNTEKTASEKAKYAAVISAPEANKVKDADLKLAYVPEKDYYTLAIDNNKAFEAEGDYEIRVVLDNGKSATLNFSVKKFDKAVSLHIEYPTQAVELDSETETPDIYFLDANSVMKKANNRVEVAATGYAVASVVPNGDNAGKIKVKNDEKYIGQTITVTAVSDKENLTASTTLTVADEAREVKLDTTRGQVNANNRVGFKVVDSTGKAVALGNDATVEVTAVVTNTGDADAKVSYSVSGSTKADLKSKGTGVINLSSNKETTATVQIMVKVSKPNTNADDNNTGLSTTYYTGTETFTFGAEADKSVVMTIGSKEIVANNVPATIDVAPFIKDNRTFVPFRALVEAFGAEVNYDEATSTVTTKLDGKTVVLTVGSTVLTVNDETVTMDVAPYIVNDRVVVPVRFVGEAFGFTVEATQDAETGATASVVFYQK